jgi:hypothetical protein
MVKYEAAEMDIVLFGAEDVISTSGLSFGGVDNGQSGSSNFEDLFPNWGQN